MTWRSLQDRLEGLDCFCGACGAGQQDAQVCQRTQEAGIETQGLAIFLLGFLELAALVQNCSEQVVSVGIGRCDGNHMPENRFRFVSLAKLKQRNSFAQIGSY